MDIFISDFSAVLFDYAISSCLTSSWIFLLVISVRSFLHLVQILCCPAVVHTLNLARPAVVHTLNLARAS